MADCTGPLASESSDTVAGVRINPVQFLTSIVVGSAVLLVSAAIENDSSNNAQPDRIADWKWAIS
jgi:hypothetical protein